MPNEWKQTPAGRVQLTDEEQAALDANRAIANALPKRKNEAIQAINERTDQLIEAATFTHGGKTFALTGRDRGKWQGIGSAGNAGGGAGQKVTATDHSRLTLANAAEAKTFFLAGVAVVSGIHTSSEALVDAVVAATDLTELDAVTDNR